MKWWTLAALVLGGCADKNDDTGETDTTTTDTDTDTDTCVSSGVDATACAGPISGTFAGDETGEITGVLNADGIMYVQFTLPDVGTINACGVIQNDGTGSVSGAQADVTIEGTYDLTACTATGTWSASSVTESGTWTLGPAATN